MGALWYYRGASDYRVKWPRDLIVVIAFSLLVLTRASWFLELRDFCEFAMPFGPAARLGRNLSVVGYLEALTSFFEFYCERSCPRLL